MRSLLAANAAASTAASSKDNPVLRRYINFDVLYTKDALFNAYNAAPSCFLHDRSFLLPKELSF